MDETPAQRAGLWTKLLTPSLSDFFFLAILVWCFMSGSPGWQSLLFDGDTGLHIRNGDYILAHHVIPDHGLFAFSKPDGVFFAFEWLSEIGFSVLHRTWGLKGIVLFSGVIIGLAVLLLLQYMIWRRVTGFVAILFTLVACTAMSIHFHARPHIFTLLFVGAVVWIVAEDRQKRTALVWLLVPLTVLWCNLHPAFLVIFAYLGLLVIGCVLEAAAFPDLRERRISDAIRYGLLGAACAAASLLNPYGFHLHLDIFEIARSPWFLAAIDEFKSPSFRGERLMHYMLLLFLGLGVVGLLVRKRNFTDALFILFLAYQSLISVRHVPLYALVAAPIIAAEISMLWREWAASQSRSSIAGVVDDISVELARKLRGPSLWTAVVIVTIALAPNIQWPTTFPDDLFPVQMVGKHKDLIAGARVFTTDQWADYLIYISYPRQKVFFDGDSGYFGETIESEYVRLLQGDNSYRQILAKYDIDLVLCPGGVALATLLRTDPNWKIVDDDGKNILIQRLPRQLGAGFLLHDRELRLPGHGHG